MKAMIKGERRKLSDLTDDTQIQIAFKINTDIPIDFCCFGLDRNEKLSDDRYMIFYNQDKSPCGAISIGNRSIHENERFNISLSKLPQSIVKVVLTVSIDGDGTIPDLGDLSIILMGLDGGKIACCTLNSTNFVCEKAIILCEFYFKDSWRFAISGQGFNGGLDALVKYFGGEVREDTNSIDENSPEQSPVGESNEDTYSIPDIIPEKVNHKYVLSEIFYNSLYKDALKEICREHKLSDEGLKDELVTRVLKNVDPKAVLNRFDNNLLKHIVGPDYVGNNKPEMIEIILKESANMAEGEAEEVAEINAEIGNEVDEESEGDELEVEETENESIKIGLQDIYYQYFTVRELRDLCYQHELPTGGLKEEIVTRIVEHIDSREVLTQLTVKQLKEVCEACTWDEDGTTYCLSTSGKKQELVEYIAQYFDDRDAFLASMNNIEDENNAKDDDFRIRDLIDFYSIFPVSHLRELCDQNKLSSAGSDDELSARAAVHVDPRQGSAYLSMEELTFICESCKWDQDGQTQHLPTSGDRLTLINRIAEFLEKNSKFQPEVNKPRISNVLQNEERATNQSNIIESTPANSSGFDVDKLELQYKWIIERINSISMMIPEEECVVGKFKMTTVHTYTKIKLHADIEHIIGEARKELFKIYQDLYYPAKRENKHDSLTARYEQLDHQINDKISELKNSIRDRKDFVIEHVLRLGGFVKKINILSG